MTIRVILADDHAVIREGLSSLLSAAGIEVAATCSNGREAIRAAAALAPDVIVMDISMPDMNGIDATREILARSPAVRVVMLSMHANRQHVHQALAAGASGYVLKDAAAAEVVSAVRAAAAGRRYLSVALPPLMDVDGAADRSPLESLSSRERQVLQLVVEGRSSAEIARILHLSPSSVDTYRSRLMKKLGVKDLPALVKFALQHGISPSA